MYLGIFGDTHTPKVKRWSSISQIQRGMELTSKARLPEWTQPRTYLAESSFQLHSVHKHLGTPTPRFHHAKGFLKCLWDINAAGKRQASPDQIIHSAQAFNLGQTLIVEVVGSRVRFMEFWFHCSHQFCSFILPVF